METMGSYRCSGAGEDRESLIAGSEDAPDLRSPHCEMICPGRPMARKLHADPMFRCDVLFKSRVSMGDALVQLCFTLSECELNASYAGRE
jgi:hypothetical protein